MPLLIEMLQICYIIGILTHLMQSMASETVVGKNISRFTATEL